MKTLGDQVLLEFDVRFVRPMYNVAAKRAEVDYNAFRDSLFDTDNVWIYICRVVKPIRFGPLHLEVGTTVVLRYTISKIWEIEICKTTTITTTLLQLSSSTLQSLVNALQFRRADFQQQPNPFGLISFF